MTNRNNIVSLPLAALLLVAFAALFFVPLSSAVSNSYFIIDSPSANASHAPADANSDDLIAKALAGARRSSHIFSESHMKSAATHFANFVKTRNDTLTQGGDSTYDVLDKLKQSFASEMDRVDDGLGVQSTLGILGENDNSIPSDLRSSNDTAAKRTSAWYVRYPPYDGWAYSYSWYKTRGSFQIYYLTYDQYSGNVGTSTNAYVNGADDDDYGYSDIYTCVGLWYWAPEYGKVELYVYASSNYNYYKVALSDEWGFSDSYSKMENDIYITVDGRAQQGVAWWLQRTGTDGYWSGYGIDAATRVFHFVDTTYTASGWKYVKVCDRQYHYWWLNDVSTSQDMTTRWNIQSVYLRVL